MVAVIGIVVLFVVVTMIHGYIDISHEKWKKENGQ